MEARYSLSAEIPSNDSKNNFVSSLLNFLPSSTKDTSKSANERLISGIKRICNSGIGSEKQEELLRELGVDQGQWQSLQSGQQRFQYAMQQLNSNIREDVKRVGCQIDNYLTNTNHHETHWEAPRRVDEFEWLKLGNKYPMWQPKLKAKLVQTISDGTNEQRLRKQLASRSCEKVRLLEESLTLEEYEKFKVDYTWGEEDEMLFLNNLNELKHKFNSTEFLKKCGRFKFISQHEMTTLAAEDISRRLDQTNKVFLSRQFLLDKYYSSRQCLSEQEMRFILKTSPMLSKCVDKNFIKAAIRSIDYEDINKMEMTIAENIISRFEQIRSTVHQSRRNYQNQHNQQTKKRILMFEKKHQEEAAREMARKMLQCYRGGTSSASLHRKVSCPMMQPTPKRGSMTGVPMNRHHPPTGLFVRDCNQQSNEDVYNHYEKHYLTKKKVNKSHYGTSISMKQFYSGGVQKGTVQITKQQLQMICRLIKSQYYQKSIKDGLNGIELDRRSERTHRTLLSTAKQSTSFIPFESNHKSSKHHEPQETMEAAIKRRIMESRQKAKGTLYVTKMLSFSAQNSYAAFKGLQANLTSEQVNTRDKKGNTALFYASRHRNIQFCRHLLGLGADPSMPCQNDNTPLHFIFKTNCVSLITQCLTSPKTPNLNALNSDKKTPLAYCSHDVLKKLKLEDGVTEGGSGKFDNNGLLESGGGKRRVSRSCERVSIRLRVQ